MLLGNEGGVLLEIIERHLVHGGVLHNLGGCKRRLLLADDALCGHQTALLVKLVGGFNGLTVLDDKALNGCGDELLLDCVTCHDVLLFY